MWTGAHSENLVNGLKDDHVDARVLGATSVRGRQQSIGDPCK